MMDTNSKIMFYCTNKTQTDFFFFLSSFFIFPKETIFFLKKKVEHNYFTIHC